MQKSYQNRPTFHFLLRSETSVVIVVIFLMQYIDPYIVGVYRTHYSDCCYICT